MPLFIYDLNSQAFFHYTGLSRKPGRHIFLHELHRSIGESLFCRRDRQPCFTITAPALPGGDGK
jgi:hypothetical protein